MHNLLVFLNNKVTDSDSDTASDLDLDTALDLNISPGISNVTQLTALPRLTAVATAWSAAMIKSLTQQTLKGLCLDTYFDADSRKFPTYL